MPPLLLVVGVLTRWIAWFSALRRSLSRREWEVRLLGLPRTRDQAAEPGLVLIQIDGLSRTQFEAALRNNRLPFVQRLLNRENYKLHTFYSGLPSSTPAVQGELFFGKKCAVPSFSFRFHETGEIVRMYYSAPAQKVEQRLAQGAVPLLAEGSAYVDNYTGGAAEAHFCAPDVGWHTVMRAANPVAWATVLLWQGTSVLRMVGLGLIEFPLAVIDFFRGLIEGRDIWKELQLVPGRVLVGIGLRELAAIGASLDVTRGVPIVHLNFLGYDEQAHGRGPSSAFAHWSLRGIDRAISAIWHAARRSACRDYDVWIYSDHGQSPVTPYHRAFGRTIHEVVAEIFGREQLPPAARGKNGQGERTARVTWLGTSRFWGWMGGLGGRDDAAPFPAAQSSEAKSTAPASENGNGTGEAAIEVSVAAMGPVGHVYTSTVLTSARLRELAEILVRQHHVPLVLWKEGGLVRALNPHGLWELPAARAEVLGSEHPFLAEAGDDLAALVSHPDSGQLVLSGYSPGGPQLTFASEYGAHAGPSPEETRAFALLPRDAPLPGHSPAYLRPLDLRGAALRTLGREAGETESSASLLRGTPVEALRVLTYNVHHCRGMDGKLSPRRIARVLAQAEADVIALQELDICRPRSGEVNQAAAIAGYLEMECHFHPAWQVASEGFGNAVLSRLPLRAIKQLSLPRCRRGPFDWSAVGEPRGALWVALEWQGIELHLITTHLGVSARERGPQVEAILGPEMLGSDECRGPLVLCGDFNAAPGTHAYRRLSERLHDVQMKLASHRPLPTWFAGRPFHRIDHVFASDELEVLAVEIPASALANVASDHLPLIAELRLRPAQEAKA